VLAHDYTQHGIIVLTVIEKASRRIAPESTQKSASKNASKHRSGRLKAGNEKYLQVMLDNMRKYVSINMSAMT
jgi:hypothetical protein